MVDFKRYVSEHSVRQITVGQSGAHVYALDNSRVAKYVRRGELADEALWDSYGRELAFYSRFSASMYRFLPRIYHCRQTGDEIQIVMEQYRPLPRERLDDAVLAAIMEVLAQIHRLPIPDFLPRAVPKPLALGSDDIAKCVAGWRSVIDEHGPLFSAADLLRVAGNINAVNEKLFTPERVLCHGDFHIDNLLLDADGGIVVCDWQGVGSGPASGDISFLLSRLSADGVRIPRERAIELYCRQAGASAQEIAVQMSLANLNTSFMFWHEYLHGSAVGRVRSIFGQMVAEMDRLLSACGMSAG